MKKAVSLLLALALVLAPLPRAAAAGSFSDIADPQTAEQAEILRVLGVVGGVGGGLFLPDGTFDRASFCKMALIIMNRGGEAALQSARVIFTDVTATHWALGYVNAAAITPSEGGVPLVRGTGDGHFLPDEPITLGQAVSILMRALGYSETDVAAAGAWYAGYLLRAASIGLTDGITCGGEDALTRAQAAALFYNLLFTSPKGKTTLYLKETLGGSVVENTILLETDDRAVRTVAGSYPIDRMPLSQELTGVPVNLYLDRDGKVLTARPLTGVTSRSLRISVAEGRYLITDTGERITVPGNTPILRPNAEETTYGEIYTDLPVGTAALLCYNQLGELDYIYLLSSMRRETSMAAKTVNDLSFSALTGENPVRLTVYKNGAPAALADARLYDAATYDADTATLYLSDRRLTGVYENLFPSPASPETVTVMGATFSVLDCALADMAGFRLGDAVTLLLTGENKVAGAVSPDEVRGNAVGVVTLDKGIATAELTWGVTVKGTVNLSDEMMRILPGKLVRVTSPEIGRLNLWPVELGEVSAAWNIAANTLGTLTVSKRVAVYERVGNSRVFPVDKSAVTMDSVPAERILYAGTDSTGEVDTLILDDVTGDCYTYGLAEVGTSPSGDGGLSTSNIIVTVTNSADSLTLLANGNVIEYHKKPLGIAASLTLRAGNTLFASAVPLTAVKDVPRSAFRDGYVTVGETRYPLAANLDDLCYNAFAKAWFPDLAAARTYAATLTVYYDKAPEQGGKVRMVVVE